MFYLWERMKIVVEPTGALARLRAFREEARLSKGKRVGVVLSGGNVDLRLGRCRLASGALEELDHPEHRRGLRRIAGLGAHHQLAGFRAVQLGEELAACLIHHELDAKLGH